ncbi:hypothetical protein BJY52DRAFT_1238420, partial [Lactarius psammicola]
GWGSSVGVGILTAAGGTAWVLTGDLTSSTLKILSKRWHIIHKESFFHLPRVSPQTRTIGVSRESKIVICGRI